MLNESLGQVVAVASDDVDHAAIYVGHIQHLIKIGRAQREARRDIFLDDHAQQT